MGFDEAAAASRRREPALACLGGGAARRARSVLVYGASGAVGTAGRAAGEALRGPTSRPCAIRKRRARALARCRRGHRLHPPEDFTQNGETYEVIFDAVGKHLVQAVQGLPRGRAGAISKTDPGFMWHVPLLMLADQCRIGDKKVRARHHSLLEAGRPLSQGAPSKRGSTARSSTARYSLEDVVEAHQLRRDRVRRPATSSSTIDGS